MWVIHKEGVPTEVAVELHLGGQSEPDNDEHCLASNLDAIFSRLQISFDNTVSPVADSFEAVHRTLEAIQRRLESLEVQKQDCSCSGTNEHSKGAAQDVYQPQLDLPRIPIYGHWCGPGFGSGAPIDAVDTACMHHDLCYGKSGTLDCGCNNSLVAELTKVLALNPRISAEARAKAAAIIAYFTSTPCVQHIGRFPIPSGPGVPFPGGGRGGVPGIPIPVPGPRIPNPTPIPLPWPF